MNEELDDARRKLSIAARLLAQIKRDVLETRKASYSDIGREDFIWHYLLQSFATMGGVSGWKGLIGNEANYQQVAFNVVDTLPDAERQEHIERVLRVAKVRYAQQKAGYIAGCYRKICDDGGLSAVRSALLDQEGREAKIAFLKSFPGIGDKYARNIMMDVYHEDFRNSIAVDSRIEAISSAWGLSFKNYGDHEEFYLAVARDAGLSGWELDRLMFGFHNFFFPPISAPAR